jgi:hypothetical protein
MTQTDNGNEHLFPDYREFSVIVASFFIFIQRNWMSAALTTRVPPDGDAALFTPRQGMFVAMDSGPVSSLIG